jgi:hypothetical protein
MVRGSDCAEERLTRVESSGQSSSPVGNSMSIRSSRSIVLEVGDDAGGGLRDGEHTCRHSFFVISLLPSILMLGIEGYCDYLNFTLQTLHPTTRSRPIA